MPIAYTLVYVDIILAYQKLFQLGAKPVCIVYVVYTSINLATTSFTPCLASGVQDGFVASYNHVPSIFSILKRNVMTYIAILFDTIWRNNHVMNAFMYAFQYCHKSNIWIFLNYYSYPLNTLPRR